MGKMKELLYCIGNPPRRSEKEGHIRKKRITWKRNKNTNMTKTKRKERAEKRLAEVKPDPVSELDKRMVLIDKNLNDLFVDELSGDIDVLSLWFEAQGRGKKERAGTHSRRKAHE